jgi:hypothetical protein
MNNKFQQSETTFSKLITRLEAFTLENIDTPLVQNAIEKAQKELTIKSIKNDNLSNKSIR